MIQYVRKHLFLVSLLLVCAANVHSQGRKQIQIIHSQTLEVTEQYGPDVNILIGDVQLAHEGATMYCDTAYYNSAENFFNAIGHIHMIKPGKTDTVNLYGDTLYYEGALKLAMVRQNVKLTKDSLTLTTHKLDFDLGQDLAYYFDGGRTETGKDTLISHYGYYYSKQDLLFFKDSVQVYNPKFTMFSDTLKHNTKAEVSYFLGPTDIISDTNYIYCENGWYNHQTNIAQFNKNAYLKSNEHLLKGDSLYYERNTGYGLAIQNVKLIDTVQNMQLWGNWGVLYEKTENALMTNKAQFVQYNQAGDSLFLHADTLRMNNDTVFFHKTDSTQIYRMVKGSKNVRMYRSDLQLKCDSLVYSFRDSIIHLYQNPVLWSDQHQLSADTIEVHTQNNAVKELYLNNASFVVSEEDTTRYNQISGKNLIGYVTDNELKKIDVHENSKSIYFAKDKEKLVGVNKSTSKNMTLYLENRQVDKIWFYEKPEATFFPINYLKADEKKLEGFQWLINLRPKDRYDIFPKTEQNQK